MLYDKATLINLNFLVVFKAGFIIKIILIKFVFIQIVDIKLGNKIN